MQVKTQERNYNYKHSNNINLISDETNKNKTTEKLDFDINDHESDDNNFNEEIPMHIMDPKLIVLPDSVNESK